MLLQRGDLNGARRIIEPLRVTHADVGDVWALEGEIAIRQRRIGEAVAAANRAAELEPQVAERQVQRARCFAIAGDTAEAKRAALSALELALERLDHLLVLGGVLVRCGEHTLALEVYRRAESRAPDNADVHRGLASVNRYLGKLGPAEAACNAAIRLDPDDYETIGLRSSLRTVNQHDHHVDELRALLARGTPHWRGEVHLAYALAKELEDLERYDESFESLRRGAELKRRHTRYDLEDDLRIFPALKRAFSLSRMESGCDGFPSAEPIFVVGLPRTGTTLVERIISSHSQVHSLGELNSLSLVMMRLVERRLAGARLRREHLPELAAALPMGELAESYLRDVAVHRGGHPRFIDKLPLNSLNIGLIHLALPNAAIVHVVRDPMDTCYAMYKYLFRNGYPFSYDLQELGAYYAAHRDLMAHWRSVLPPGRIYDIRYEDVVEDLPGEARKLLAHLALPWEPACEAFHDNRNPSMTGSATQVRRPVYRDSVGRWRKLERQLGPLRRALVDGGVAVS
jgi:cytochrome c-type biogenesis protein CcmH/NrfG